MIKPQSRNVLTTTQSILQHFGCFFFFLLMGKPARSCVWVATGMGVGTAQDTYRLPVPFPTQNPYLQCGSGVCSEAKIFIIFRFILWIYLEFISC